MLAMVLCPREAEAEGSLEPRFTTSPSSLARPCLGRQAEQLAEGWGQLVSPGLAEGRCAAGGQVVSPGLIPVLTRHYWRPKQRAMPKVLPPLTFGSYRAR